MVAPTYWGYGNLENLHQVLALARKGKQVIVLEEGLSKDYDYTGGEAERLLRELIAAGARPVEGLERLVEFLEC